MQGGLARVGGVVLAAGSGRRYGGPKALVDDGAGPWVLRAVGALAGCDPVVVVTGADGAEVAALLPPTVLVAHNSDFQSGMGSSLRVGLRALDPVPLGDGASAPPVDAALVMLVDLPGVGSSVIRRILLAAGPPARARSVLIRSSFDGVPGHPVLIGRDHWSGVSATAVGDSGAREYFLAHGVRLVECGDVGSGEDVDTPVRR